MSEILGKCPVCGGDIVETPRAFSCANWREQDGGCKFAIWKEIAGKKISKSVAKTLLEKRETGVLKGFYSKKKDREFEAALVLEEQGDGTLKIAFKFPSRN